MATQQAHLTALAEHVMGLQTMVVGLMAAVLFYMLRPRGEKDAEILDPTSADEEYEGSERQQEAERRVARASLYALGVGALGAAISWQLNA